jgi:hypothetical protein
MPLRFVRRAAALEDVIEGRADESAMRKAVRA